MESLSFCLTFNQIQLPVELSSIIGIFLIGFILLTGGAYYLVEGASSMAERYGVSPLIIGLTVVALGGTSPEMVVNITATAHGHSEIALSNIIGSNLFNLYLVIAIIGLIKPIHLSKNTALIEVPLTLLGIVVFFVLANDELIFNRQHNMLSRLDGLVLLLCFGVFIYYAVDVILDPKSNEGFEIKPLNKKRIFVEIIGGLVALTIGAQLVVEKAAFLAEYAGVSQKLVGLTIVATGTSLPELSTAIIASFRGKTAIALGSALGSTIINTLLITGVSAVIKPLKYPIELNFDLYFYIYGGLMLFISMFMYKKHRLTRAGSMVFFLFFVGYIYFLFIRK